MDNLDEIPELKELQDLLQEIQTAVKDENPQLPKDNLNPIEFYKNKLSPQFIITKYSNNSTNNDPEYTQVGDSGFDLRADIKNPIVLKSLERKLIPTGLKFELSPNTELQVRPRSGMALKHGISVLNTPGTVDEGYRGEVGIIAVNLSKDTYTIQPGERIAQGVIINVIGQNISKLIKTNELNETQRGSGGFGSTGKE
jgi:dUTP pyrophosphatase